MCMSWPQAWATGTSCAGRILAGRGARVVRAGVLLDWQCVQFGSEQYGGSAAIGQDARHSRTADARVDREVIFMQFPGDTLGGAVLLVG